MENIITNIPFNKFIGIQKSNEKDYIFELDNLPQYLNHVDTIHASVQYALAEATSGQYLIGVFKDLNSLTVIPVVKNVEVKYKKPAIGRLFSKADMNDTDIRKVHDNLISEGRTLLNVSVQIYNLQDEVTMLSVFTWYLKVINNT